MIGTSISPDQRFTPQHRCPVCGGAASLPRHRGGRCWGFMSSDGRYAHCSREEHAGDLPQEDSGTYAHRLDGPCRCGQTHGTEPPAAKVKQNGRDRRAGGRRVTRKASHTLRTADGTVLAIHQRRYFDDGTKEIWWELPDGTRGLGGIKPACLPLYGIHELPPDASEVVVTEGEPARDALASLGIPAVATVTGASTTPSVDVWRSIAHVQTIYFWPDNDDDGQKHREKSVARLREIGHSDIRTIIWPHARPKADAADFVKAGGTAEDAQSLKAGAERVAEPTASERAAEPRLEIEWMSDVVAKPIEWIWPRWLAKGKLGLLGGLGGIGKGTLMAEIASQLSTGRGRLPDGTPAPLVKTLFLLSEDAPDDTLKPRLEIHGAEMRSVAHIRAVREPDGASHMLSLGKHLPLLERAIEDNGFGLIVIDALSDFMAGSDRNSEGEVRDILTPLADMARRTGVAIMGVMHPGKGHGDLKAFQRLLGASAFGNVARCVWLAAESPDDDGRNLLGVDKSNLAIKPKALVWSRQEDAPIVWHGESESAIGDAFGATTAKPRDDAEGFLRELLKEGSVETHKVRTLAKAAGLAWRTVERAKTAIGVEVVRVGGLGGSGRWVWKLPNGSPVGDKPDPNPETEPDPEPAPPKTATTRPNTERTPLSAKTATPRDTQVAVLADGLRPPQNNSGGGLSEKPHQNPKTATTEDVADLGVAKTATGPPDGPNLLRPPHVNLTGGGLSGDGAGDGPTSRVGHDADDVANSSGGPELDATVRNLLALSPAELEEYRTQVAAAPPDDPMLDHDREALRCVEYLLAREAS